MYSYYPTCWPYQTYPYPYKTNPWTSSHPYFAGSALPHPWTMPSAPQGSGAHMPGGMDPATSYMFPAEHTKVKIFTGPAWTPGNSSAQGQKFAYYTVPLDMTVDELIARGGGGDNWIMTELYEQGGGDFMRGMEIAAGTNGANATLKACGFSRSNVCVWIHKP